MLVFIIFGILMSILGFVCLLFTSIQLEVKKLHIQLQYEKWNVTFEMMIVFLFLNKIAYLRISLNQSNIPKWLQGKRLNLQMLRSYRQFSFQDIQELKHLLIVIKEFELKGYITTWEPIFSLYLYTFLHAVLPLLLAPKTIGHYKNQLQFINHHENNVNIQMKGIICVKMVNIINTLRKIMKKGGKRKNGKSSNRGAYAYCHE